MRNAVAIFAEGSREIYDHYQFSPAVKVGSTVYLSGIIGMLPDGTATKDEAEEYHIAFREIERLLAAAGGSIADIVTAESFHVTDNLTTDIEVFLKVRGEYLSKPYPAWTAIGVASLGIPGGRVEIRITAVLASK
jgi:enamine deaminase RidA (YjgF/YER057c/UK114 family)